MKLVLLRIAVLIGLFLMSSTFTGCNKYGCPQQMSFDPANRGSYSDGKNKSSKKKLKKASKMKSGVIPK